MCLKIKNYKGFKESILINKEPITVYKLLTKDPVTGKLLSPWRNMEYKIGKTYEAELKQDIEEDEISEGLHAFKNEEAARFHLYSIGFFEMVTRHIFECTIPPYSQYVEGVHNDIVSNRLIVKREVPYKSLFNTYSVHPTSD